MMRRGTGFAAMLAVAFGLAVASSLDSNSGSSGKNGHFYVETLFGGSA